ncbi:hypothetical protein PSU4_07030 [Pseudonocardia sulfidoxydans NBRC 16205]|uniref:Uncharacterized protein n=1 Tax=Pseudonocardia sulfidoxydans NBRC 16205 TaxID=1223511 RepID=A0A511DAB0_9PSEU|nr:hypothetical protein PSU4_07030 [Pseudonocardia sulfidoxydans NBRC 16205]
MLVERFDWLDDETLIAQGERERRRDELTTDIDAIVAPLPTGAAGTRRDAASSRISLVVARREQKP